MTVRAQDRVIRTVGGGLMLLALLAGCFVPADCWPRPAEKHAYGFSARSPKWRTTRDAFVATNALCVFCGRKADDVHHITPVHVWPEGELVVTNLVALCEKHHFEWGHLGDWRAYNPNVLKNAEWYKSVMRNKRYKKQDGEGGK